MGHVSPGSAPQMGLLKLERWKSDGPEVVGLPVELGKQQGFITEGFSGGSISELLPFLQV